MGGPCYINGIAYESLDNFLCRPFFIDGVEYMSAEQYFQCMKFTDEEYRERIRATASGSGCWALGNTRDYELRDDWEEVKVDVMYEANKAKFTQHRDLRLLLIGTRGRIVPEGFPFWVKWNAVILERLREELRPPKGRNAAVLADLTRQMDEYRAEMRAARLGQAEQLVVETVSKDDDPVFQQLSAMQQLVAETLSKDNAPVVHQQPATRPRFALIAQRLHEELAHPSASRPLVVLLLCGAMNPVHRGHLQALLLARRALEAEPHNYAVLGGLISPTNDDYVRGKAPSAFFPAATRLAMIDAAIHAEGCEDFLESNAWESDQSWWYDFPEVRVELECQVNDHFAGLLGGRHIEVKYVCGQDNCVYNGAFFKSWAVCITRDGPRKVPADATCTVISGAVATFSVSSSLIRNLLEVPGPLDRSALEELTYPAVVDMIAAQNVRR